MHFGQISSITGVALAASPASPGAGLSFDIWPVFSGFHSSNSEKKWPNVKNRVEFQSRAGLTKVAHATLDHAVQETVHRRNKRLVLLIFLSSSNVLCS